MGQLTPLVSLSEVLATADGYAERYERLHVPLHTIDFSNCDIRFYLEDPTPHGSLYSLLIPRGDDVDRELWFWPGRNLLMVRTRDIIGIRAYSSVPDTSANLSELAPVLPETIWPPRLLGMLNGRLHPRPGSLVGEINWNRILILERCSAAHWEPVSSASHLRWAKHALRGPEAVLAAENSDSRCSPS